MLVNLMRLPCKFCNKNRYHEAYLDVAKCVTCGSNQVLTTPVGIEEVVNYVG